MLSKSYQKRYSAGGYLTDSPTNSQEKNPLPDLAIGAGRGLPRVRTSERHPEPRSPSGPASPRK